MMTSSELSILVVLPMYGGSLPIGIYCARALAQLGYSVRIFDASQLYCGFNGIKKLDLAPSRAQSLENAFLRFVSQAIWAMAQEQQPGLVLALAQAPLDKSILLRLRQNGIRTVMWFVEDYRVFNYWRLFAPLYDAFAVIQKEPFLSELDGVGQKHAFYLPLAALPDFHKKATLTPAEMKEYASDISFLGAGYPNRRLAFRPLADKDFKIWGSDWDGEAALAKNIQRGGARIGEEESVKIYSAAKVNLNLHSNVDPEKLVGHGDFVNPRTFELAAMGSFQLVDRRSLMAELFAEDELATFDDINGMYDAIEYFLRHPEEREKYASRAKARVLEDHTYEQRMKTLVQYMEQHFGPLAKVAGRDECPDVPGGLKEELEKLALRLGLSRNAAFEDIVEAIRRQSGELSEAETLILFLDEWRKQYGK